MKNRSGSEGRTGEVREEKGARGKIRKQILPRLLERKP
jgi:hypothetical protein